MSADACPPETSKQSRVDPFAQIERRYTTLKTLHDGPRARICQVRDTILGRALALKQVKRGCADYAAYFRQMQACAALNHANIVRIYDLDEPQAQVVMEFVDGWNLRAILQAKHTLSFEIALSIAMRLVNGLRHAHARNIAHQALCPEHVLLTRRGDVKIIGFRALGASMRNCSPDIAAHTAYMPPEWFDDHALTPAANVFSFGLIAAEMFSRACPFAPEQIVAASQERRPLILDDALFPSGLGPILQACLEPDMARRTPDIRAIGTQLLEWSAQCRDCTSEPEHLRAYQDFLLMAWADGKLSPEETAFLAHKRAELEISECAAQQAEREVKQELAQLSGQSLSES